MDTRATVNIAIETFAAVISLIMLISLMLSKSRKTALNRIFLCLLVSNAIVLLSDMAGWLFEGSSAPFARRTLYACTFIVIIVCQTLSAFYLDYLVTYISTKAKVSRKIVRVCYALVAVFIVITVLAQLRGNVFYYDSLNRYQRGSLFYLPYVPATLSALIVTITLARYGRRLGTADFFALLSYIILPTVAFSVQFISYGTMSPYVINTVAWLIIYVRIHLEQDRLLTQKELELANSRIDIMLSQIQPHFLYNTLNTIENLCTKDGRQAAELVRSFAVYLRENMDSLTQKELIMFGRELSHIKAYLEIEKKRFGERLIVAYDLETTEFALPILTVQPIVENAVCHGVLEKEGGGTVTISTRETPDAFNVIVSDDGIGYETEETSAGSRRFSQSKRSHVGLENVRSRLAAQCGGNLVTESEVGKGTVVTITIPKRRAVSNESDNSRR